MPQQPDHAQKLRLCKIGNSLEGRKVRIAGRALSYDVVTGLLLLVDGQHALIIDVSAALDNQSRAWATERLSTIIVIGYLEQSEESLKVPTGMSRDAYIIDDRRVLRALLVVPAPTLDLELWNSVLKDEDENTSGR